jgi:hypothetical protein
VIDLVSGDLDAGFQSGDLDAGFHSLGVRAAIEEKLVLVSGKNISVSTKLQGTSLTITALFVDNTNRCSVTAEIAAHYDPYSLAPFGDPRKTPEWFAKLLWDKISTRLAGGGGAAENLLACVQRAVPELTWALSDSECLGTRESDGELLVRVGISGGRVSAWTPEQGHGHPAALVSEKYNTLDTLRALLTSWWATVSTSVSGTATEKVPPECEKVSPHRRLTEVLRWVDDACNAQDPGSATSAVVEEPDGSSFGVIHAEVGYQRFEVQVDMSDVGWLYAYDEAGRLVAKAPFDPKNGTSELLKALFPSNAVKVEEPNVTRHRKKRKPSQNAVVRDRSRIPNVSETWKKQEAQMAEETKKEESPADTLAKDASEAVKRTAAKQFLRLMTTPAVGLLLRHLDPAGSDTTRARIATFLGGPIGQGGLAFLLGVVLPKVWPNDSRVAVLATELRRTGLELVGDSVMEVLMGPLREVLTLYLQDPTWKPPMLNEPAPAMSLPFAPIRDTTVVE